MATWQFDLHCLPYVSVKQHYGELPEAISREDYDTGMWWDEAAAPPSLREQIGKLLPAASSWSEHIQTWGKDDGDRIDLVLRNGRVVDLFVRVDVRSISYTFLNGLIDLIRRNKWLTVTEQGKILQLSSVTDVLTEIRRSDAFRYVKDPKRFLDELRKDRER